MCATDLALARGYMGFAGVPGHEFVGVALDGPLAGRRVVGEINAGCGVCARCVGGDPRHCAERTVLGILDRPGAFAEELALPASCLLAVPDSVSDRQAVFCEPLAAALAVGEALEDVSGARALVVGDGRLGLLCAWALHRLGAEVTVAGRHPERQALLPGGVRLETGLCEEEGPGGPRDYEVIVEASGRPGTLRKALSLLRVRGTLVLKTTAEEPVTLDLAPLVVDEQRIIGSRCGRFEPALEWLASDPPPVVSMIDEVLPLEAGSRVFARAAQPGTLKVLLDPNLR